MMRDSAYGKGRVRADRIMRKLGRLCGVDAVEDEDAELNRQRLILAEEEDLPLEDPVPDPVRAPYISPALVAVTMPSAAGSSSDSRQAPKGSTTPTPATPVASSSNTEASDAVAKTLDTLPDGEMSASAELALDDIMARVAALEEQGRLVEASALMANALTPTRKPKDG